ncbi:MAG: YhdP family protein [Pseudomonadota bacterium]|nr:YhdP family protein [Pseudomonadota bacterium]
MRLLRLKHLVPLVCSGGLLLFALAVAGFHYLSTQAPHYRTHVEAWLGENIGVPVTIGGMSLSWHRLGPEVALWDVTLQQPTEGEELIVGRVAVGFSLFDLIVDRTVLPQSLAVVGADIELERTAEGQWLFEGIPLNPAGTAQMPDGIAVWSSVTSILRTMGSISFRNSTVHLRLNDYPGSEQHFSGLDMALRTTGQRHSLTISSGLAGMLGQDLSLQVKAVGDLETPTEWSGSFSAAFAQARPGQYLRRLVGEAFDLSQSRFDLDIEGAWNGPRLDRLAVRLDAAEVALPAVGSLPAAEIDHFKGGFVWSPTRDGWALSGRNIDVALNGDGWTNDHLRVEWSQGSGPPRLTVDAQFFRLQDLLRLADCVPSGTKYRVTLPTDAIRAFAPVGDFSDLKLVYQPVGDTPWQGVRVSARFANAGWNASGRIPGADNLSGMVEFDAGRGRARLLGENVDFYYPHLFTEPWPSLIVDAALAFRPLERGWHIEAEIPRLANSDLDTAGRFTAELVSGRRPVLDIEAQFQNGNGASVSRYLPQRGLPPRTRKWLQQAILDGQIVSGEMVLRGDMSRFPFRNGEGEFRVEAGIENGALEVHPDWPLFNQIDGILRFQGPGLNIDVHRADVNNLSINQARVEIENLKNAVLVAEGQASGDNSEALRFLRASPIGRSVKELLTGLDGKGSTEVTLRLDMPLKKVSDVAVKGRVDWRGARFDKPAWNLSLADVTGRLLFTEQRFDADRITASLDGVPVEIDVQPIDRNLRTEGVWPTRVSARGRVAAETLRRHVPGLNPQLVLGETDWQGQLDIWPAGGVQWLATSDLVGFDVAWPRYLAKPADDVRAFRIEGRHLGETQTVAFDYGTQVAGDLRLVRNTGKWRLAGGDVALGEPAVTDGTAEGVSIRGRIPQFSVTEWMNVFESDIEPSSIRWPSWLAWMDVRIDRLDGIGPPQEGVRLKLGQQDRAAVLEIVSPLMNGRVVLPPDQGGEPWRIDLDRLNLSWVSSGPPKQSGVGMVAGPSFDPRVLPPIQLRCDDLNIMDLPLGEMALDIRPVEKGIEIERLAIRGTKLNTDAAGQWIHEEAGESTQLTISTTSDDPRRATRHLGYPGVLDAASFTMTANLRWLGAPWVVSGRNVGGEIQIDAKDGYLYVQEADLRASMFLGLFSLYTIPRRLYRDFGDVFRPSMPFSNIHGEFQIRDQELVMESLKLEGPAADVAITGKTHLVDLTFDQEILVQPSLSASLALASAVAGTVAGGPLVGAAMLLGQQLVRWPVGDMVEIRYQLTGDWRDPILERIEGPFNLPDAS